MFLHIDRKCRLDIWQLASHICHAGDAGVNQAGDSCDVRTQHSSFSDCLHLQTSLHHARCGHY